MRYLSVLLLVAFAACSDSSGLAKTGTNFSVTNRSSDPATIVLHQTDWNGTTWVDRPDTAYLLTVQPSVCTDVLLNLDGVAGSVTVPDSTLPLSVFWLAESNTWTVTVLVESGPVVHRASRLRGEGCAP